MTWYFPSLLTAELYLVRQNTNYYSCSYQLKKGGRGHIINCLLLVPKRIFRKTPSLIRR